MLSDRIHDFAQSYSANEVIFSFDADFDVPLRHGYALGILRVLGAFSPSSSDSDGTATRVGAFWCDVVRTDVEYDLLEGLRLVEASRADAERLLAAHRSARHRDDGCEHSEYRKACDGCRQVFNSYVTARWFDGAGKILYRVGSYSRARINFSTAVDEATISNLWWCRPDLRSNFLRSDFEEVRQTTGSALLKQRLGDLVDQLRSVRDETVEVGRSLEIVPGLTVLDDSGRLNDDQDLGPVRIREFLRGYSSVLHNLAVALRQHGKTTDSRKVSEESLAISARLNDGYRIGQALNHQALLDDERAPELYRQLQAGSWQRGKRIARQNLARIEGGVGGANEMRALLDELSSDPTGSRGAGMDIEIQAYTVRIYGEIVDELIKSSPNDYDHLLRDAHDQRLELARSVRRAVAVPAYKRAYASAIRPNYLERIADLISSPLSENITEEAFGLTEESSARELLDMLSSSDLPQLDPARPIATKAIRVITSNEQPDGQERRRSVLRLTDTEIQEQQVEELTRRQAEFEGRFLQHPVESAPHDPEIAHRIRMYAVNNPTSCIVRYFTYGPRDATLLGVFVFRGARFTCVTGIPYKKLRDLAQKLAIRGEPPTKAESELIWELLIAPAWDNITTGGTPNHLVVIPTDHIFALPVHVASPPSPTSLPLAAICPMSYSVSATAFVGRGRHLLKRQPIAPTDTLAAIVVKDELVSGAELVDTGWPSNFMLLAGKAPVGLDGVLNTHNADWAGVEAVREAKPEFFIYAGHGNYNPQFEQLGPHLQLDGDLLTQYDIALRLRLPRNKLTILGACLAGQGTQTDGGDVVGFLRSLIAAGAGAIGTPLWAVLDDAMVRTVRGLLKSSRAALSTEHQSFDFVHALHIQYRSIATQGFNFKTMVENMPICLYL